MLSDLTTYEGGLLKGKRHGEGFMQWSDDTSFWGEWKDDMMVKGKYVAADGVTYEGTFENDER